MKSLIRTILLTLFAFSYACSGLRAQMVGGNVFMKNSWLEAGQAPNGSFGPASAPAGYHPVGGPNLSMVYDYGHDGWSAGSPPYFGDYTYRGTPHEGWSIEVNGARSDAFFTNSFGTAFWDAAPLTSSLWGSNVSGSVSSAVWQGNAGPGGALSITQTTTINPSANWIIVNTVFQNTGSSGLTGLYYERTCDPDNDHTYSSDFLTNNTIVYQNDAAHRVMVNSRGAHYSNAYLALATKDCRAKAMIYNSWPPVQNVGLTLHDMYNQTVPSTYGIWWYGLGGVNADVAIGLIYDLGSLSPGQTTSITYAYILDGDASINSISFPSTPPVSAGTITGPSPICTGKSYAYLNTTGTPGGTWSCSALATIDPVSGVLTAGSTPGTVTITYSVPADGCHGASVTTRTVNILPSPVFSITPPFTVCSGVPYTLSTSFLPPYASGGLTHSYSWTTGHSTPSINQLKSTCWGYSAVYSVTVTNNLGCSSTGNTHVNIDAKPCAGTITCPGNICAGNPVSYICTVVDNNGPGTWSITGGASDVTIDPSSGVLTINSTMVTPRTVTVTFTVTNSCGSESKSCTFKVYPSPQFTVIQPSHGCSGVPYTMTVSLTPPYPAPGTTNTYLWSNGVTTPTMTDVKYGVSYTWLYGITVTNNWGCSTTQNPSLTVWQTEARIETCPPPLCVGQSATVWGYMSGVSTFTGSWSWSPASVLSAVTTSGSSIVITGASAGTATLTYSAVNTVTGCPDIATCIVTVNPAPGAITGPTVACVGNTLTLSGTPSGGVWSSGNTLRATVNSAGEVTGVAPGTVSIGYSFGGTCSASYIITVNPSPTPVIKECVHELCVGNSATILGDPAYATGYTINWSVTPPSGGPITLTPMGNDAIVTGNVPGGATISYSVTDANGCVGTDVCIVNVHPAPPPITGPTDVCQNRTITLTGTPAGGTWVSSNTAVATVGSAGDVMGVSGGTVVIDYIIPGPGGCYSETTVNVTPRATACVQWAFDPDCGCNAFIFNGTPGANVNYNVLDCSGTSLGMMSVTLDGSGYASVLLSSLPSGACRICVVTVEHMGCSWPCNCVASPLGKCCAVAGAPRGIASSSADVEEETPAHAHIDIVPNPNKGEFTISGTMPSDRDVMVEVVDVLGQVVYSTTIKVTNKAISHAVTLDGSLANGMYLIKISNAEVNEVLRFALRR